MFVCLLTSGNVGVQVKKQILPGCLALAAQGSSGSRGCIVSITQAEDEDGNSKRSGPTHDLGTLDKLVLWRHGHELDGKLVQNSAGVTSDAVVPLGGFLVVSLLLVMAKPGIGKSPLG